MNAGQPGGRPSDSGGSSSQAIIVVLVGVAVIGGLIGVLFLGGGGDDQATDTGPASTIPVADAPASTTSEPAPTSSQVPDDDRDPLLVGPDTEDLARAAVLLLQLDGQGNPVCFSGSGSLVDPGGKILTNAHVVWNDPTCPYEQLGVAIVGATDEPPSLQYLADVVALDDFLDLAVVQITTDITGNAVAVSDLPYIELGDSSTVGLGDSLRILGFPGIGGDTITFTRGAVSGFVAERGVDDIRAWIKTDATIAGGNSGGMAVNEGGLLVGVPTTAGAGDAATTDCRVIEDTNADGFIDDADSCIPIGGFINGLRPVNLALPLIDRAESGIPIEPVAPQIEPSADFALDDVMIEDVYFSPGVTDDDQPTEIVSFLPSGVDRVCAFWTYSGMADGVSYDAIWRIDGAADTDASFLDDAWAGGESGEWWVCAINDTGLTDGLYEFEFSVAGEFLASEAIFVGGDRQPVSITLDNQSSETICYVQISPTLSGYWGGDELGLAEVIEPQSTRIFVDLVSGRYDMIARNCELDPMNEWLEIDVTGDEILIHAG